MKKIYFTIFTILMACSMTAQENNRQQTDALPYDSLSNFLGRNAWRIQGKNYFLKD